MQQLKTCRKCGEKLPATLEFFYKNNGGKFGLTPRCKPCVNEDNKLSHAKRLKENPERVRALATARTMKNYYKNIEASQDRHRKHQAKRRADPIERAKINMAKRANGARLTQEEFDVMFAFQSHVCAICLSSSPGSKMGWNIDHCHKTKRVRFILCAHCNRGLGAFRDNPDWLRKAANMLEAIPQN